ncbi:sigma-70 family RNA polymerase sigma factor [Saltatorellus ferox]
MPPDPEELLAERLWLRSLSARLVGASDADDLAQDVWLQTLEAEGRGGPVIASNRGWLTGVARKMALRRHRRDGARSARERIHAADALDGDPPLHARAADELAERAELERHVVAELLALREPIRSTLLFRFQAGLSAAEIARRTGVPDGTVRRRIKTGLDELRERMNARFGGQLLWGPVLLGSRASLAKAPSVAALSLTSLAALKKLAMVLGLLLLGFAWVSRIQWSKAETSATPEWIAPSSALAPPMLEVAAAGSGERTPAMTLTNTMEGAGRLIYRFVGTEGQPLAVTQALTEIDGHRVELGSAVDGLLLVNDEIAAQLARAHEARASLVVCRSNAWPCTFEASVRPGEHTLAWPAGRTVSGRLLEEGRSPGEPIRMRLGRDIGWSGRPTALALDTRAEPLPMEVVTASDGSFTILDLPEDWRGWLKLDRGWWFDTLSETSGIFTSKAVTLSHLRVERMPRIVGRLVSSESGEPLPMARIRVMEQDGSLGTGYPSILTDSEGRFEWIATPGVWTELVLGINPELVARELSPIDASSAHVTDLGDLELASAIPADLMVLDAKGDPMEGASVGYEFDWEPSSVVTNSAGRCTAWGPPNGRLRLRVSAEGHARRHFDLPLPGSRETLELKLERCQEIDLRVVDSAGEPAIGVRVDYLVMNPGADHAERDSQLSDEVGQVALVGFPMDASITCGFLEADGTWARAPMTVLPGPDGVFRGELTVIPQGRVPLRGRVLTKDGEPVAGALVSIIGGDHMAPRTDADGRFDVQVDARLERLMIDVRAMGFPVKTVFLPPPSDPDFRELGGLEIVMGEIRKLTLELISSTGEPVKADGVRPEQINDRGQWRDSSRVRARGTGRYEIAGLSGDEVRLTVWRDQVQHECFVPPGVTAFSMVIREPQAVQVDLSAVKSTPGLSYLSLTRIHPEKPELSRQAWSQNLSRSDLEAGALVVHSVPGTYRIHVGTFDGEVASALVEIRPGEPASVRLVR